MIRYTIKLAGRLVLLVAMLFGLGFLTAKVADAHPLHHRLFATYHDDRARDCNPRTYGLPHSCHVAPVIIGEGVVIY